MENWFEKFERKQDEKRETELNSKLNRMIEEFENRTNLNSAEEIRLVKEITQLYHQLMIEVFPYDEDDYLKKKQELKILQARLEKQKYREEKESKSWEDFEQEENLEENEQEERE